MSISGNWDIKGCFQYELVSNELKDFVNNVKKRYVSSHLKQLLNIIMNVPYTPSNLSFISNILYNINIDMLGLTFILFRQGSYFCK